MLHSRQITKVSSLRRTYTLPSLQSSDASCHQFLNFHRHTTKSSTYIHQYGECFTFRHSSTLIFPNRYMQNVQSRNSSSATVIESQKETYIPNFFNVLYSKNFQIDDTQKTGLFNYDQLTEAFSLYRLRKEAQERCEELRNEIKIRPITDIHTMLNAIDEISNVLCKFLDLVEFLRNVHPSIHYRKVANETWMQFHSYLHSLNADSSIHDTLREIIAINETLRGTGKEFNEEQERVATLLKRDMEKNGGVHIQELDASIIQELNERIDRLVGQYISCVEDNEQSKLPSSNQLWLTSEEMQQLKRTTFKKGSIPVIGMNKKTSHYLIDAQYSNMLMYNCPISEIRRKAFITFNSVSEEGANCLADLVKARNDYAQYMHFPSFAHWATKDNVIKSPEKATEFLEELHSLIQPKIKRELSLLREIKQKYENTDELHQWDKYFYSKLVQKQLGVNKQISQYFPLHRCLEGIYMICEKVFSIRLEPVPMKQGEAWDPLVRKLEVIHMTEGVLGYIYLDLHERPNKISTCANFSVRVAKKLKSQKPISCMVCAFDYHASRNDEGICLLSFNDLTTLFHEFGHALHTVIGQSSYQSLSGTRTAIDFVEMPSQFMEHFVSDYRVVSKFALHYKTNEPLPLDLFQKQLQKDRLFSGLDMEEQLLLSIIDLKMFGPEGVTSNPSQIFKEVKNKYSSFPFVDGTNPEARILHFSNYAAGYYSYLFCKMCSSHIYHKFFDEDPFNREVGGEYISKVIVPGGSKSPNQILKDILHEDPNPKYLLQEFDINSEISNTL